MTLVGIVACFCFFLNLMEGWLYRRIREGIRRATCVRDNKAWLLRSAEVCLSTVLHPHKTANATKNYLQARDRIQAFVVEYVELESLAVEYYGTLLQRETDCYSVRVARYYLFKIGRLFTNDVAILSV